MFIKMSLYIDLVLLKQYPFFFLLLFIKRSLFEPYFFPTDFCLTQPVLDLKKCVTISPLSKHWLTKQLAMVLHPQNWKPV